MKISRSVIEEVRAVSRGRRRGMSDHEFRCPDCGSVLRLEDHADGEPSEAIVVRRMDGPAVSEEEKS